MPRGTVPAIYSTWLVAGSTPAGPIARFSPGCSLLALFSGVREFFPHGLPVQDKPGSSCLTATLHSFTIDLLNNLSSRRALPGKRTSKRH